MSDAKWFAVYTFPRWEKKVTDQLRKKKITAYSPFNKITSQHNDRKKTVLTPLFSSYVFVCLSDKERSFVTQIPGVINFMYWLGEPAVIQDEEIETIKHFMNVYQEVTVEKAPVSRSGKVHVEDVAVMRRKGSVLEVLNTKVKASLPSLGHTLIAEIRKDSIELFTYSKKGELNA